MGDYVFESPEINNLRNHVAPGSIIRDLPINYPRYGDQYVLDETLAWVRQNGTLEQIVISSHGYPNSQAELHEIRDFLEQLRTIEKTAGRKITNRIVFCGCNTFAFGNTGNYELPQYRDYSWQNMRESIESLKGKNIPRELALNLKAHEANELVGYLRAYARDQKIEIVGTTTTLIPIKPAPQSRNPTGYLGRFVAFTPDGNVQYDRLDHLPTAADFQAWPLNTSIVAAEDRRLLWNDCHISRSMDQGTTCMREKGWIR